MKDKRILQHVLKKKWFDMIASGIKKEEYRDLKPYYSTRLLNHKEELALDNTQIDNYSFKDFDIVRFYLGYKKNRPSIDVEFKGTTCREGKPEWGAVKGVKYFVIRLGDRIK